LVLAVLQEQRVATLSLTHLPLQAVALVAAFRVVQVQVQAQEAVEEAVPQVAVLVDLEILLQHLHLKVQVVGVVLQEHMQAVAVQVVVAQVVLLAQTLLAHLVAMVAMELLVQ
jgi:hypothetical protein